MITIILDSRTLVNDSAKGLFNYSQVATSGLGPLFAYHVLHEVFDNLKQLVLPLCKNTSWIYKDRPKFMRSYAQWSCFPSPAVRHVFMSHMLTLWVCSSPFTPCWLSDSSVCSPLFSCFRLWELKLITPKIQGLSFIFKWRKYVDV